MTNTELQSEKPIASGKYTYIGIDIDTTGRRILDEIVHIAAYNPTEQFDQYVIPVMNLNPAARQRHHLRVITVGFFRMLKCTATNKVLKCKTEIVALKSFLDWLEERKNADTESDGVILIYHESIKFTPFMLLEAFKKYDLLERFMHLVTAFVDGNALTEAKNADASNGDTAKSNSSRDLSKSSSTEEIDDEARHFEGNAMVRARMAYKVIHQLAKSEHGEEAEITTDFIKDYVHSVNGDIVELTDQNKCIDLQHSFRPVFVQYFKTNLYHRYKAVTFRRVLAEKGYDLKSLEEIWTEKKKDGLTEIISELDEIKEENRAELVDILDSYFDPEKEPIVPVTKKSTRRRSFRKGSNKENRRSRNGIADKNGNVKPRSNNKMDREELQVQTPDSTAHSPRRQRRFRKRSINNRQLTPMKKTEDPTTTTAVDAVKTDLTHQLVSSVTTGLAMA